MRIELAIDSIERYSRRMQLEVNRDDFHETRTVETQGEVDTARLEPGQIRLSIERFALTTNNITYAVAGDMLDYWGFFPSSPATDALGPRFRRWGSGPSPSRHIPTSPSAAATSGSTRWLHRRSSSTPPRTAAPSAIVGPHRADHAATYTDFRDVTTDVQCSGRTRPTSTSCCGACS